MPTRLDNYSTATPYQYNRDAIFQCMHPDCREPVEDDDTLCDYCAEEEANNTCPRCEGTGDYCYQGADGYGVWGRCERCKGTGKLADEMKDAA